MKAMDTGLNKFNNNMISNFTKKPKNNLSLYRTVTLAFALIMLSISANAQYCNSGFFSSGCSAFGDQIDGFTTSGGSTNISNTNSGCSSGSYSYVSSQTHTTVPSGTVNFTINNNPNYGEYYNIFVDWNQDGDFFDAGETVYTAYINYSANGTGSFSVPSSATPGLTRLRVFANYGGYATNACTGGTWGEVEDYDFYIVSNCNAPASVTTTLIASMSVDFNWTPVTNSQGYQYAITTTGNPPQTGTATTNTSATIKGLTPSTLYYLHVRNMCTGYGSVWTTIQFTTLPPCVVAPSGINVPYVDSNSANVSWPTVGTGLEYDYIVQLDTTAPDTNSNIKTTTSNQIGLSALEAGKTYYFFLRVRCQGNDTSGWILDSLYVPFPCRAPNVMFSDINSNRAVAYWDAPITATSYEILNSSSMTTPTTGIPTVQQSYLFSYLDEGKVYYMYAKSYCDDKGIKSESPWATFLYSTWALDVNDLDVNNQMSVYPNPVDRQMTVDIQGQVGENASLHIMDVTGRVLSVHSISSGRKAHINVEQLQPGMYILQFSDNDRKEQVKFNKF
ncbi:MAG: T9SS type A sorting domain-containing protein [Chitinophagaceae bacterium]|nr:T9SS type A sorting domain-containing protein [Chitinophagaceae bacterium]MCB9045504.1 T9SS type A sorting domain-containing protein [Chitinophagales bacterium]